ncbi:MAG: ATP-binding protein [Acidimicrobiia bacterium]
MSGPRRRLRTRLLVAMVAIALGTLVLTALVTAGLARSASVDAARSDLKDQSSIIADELDQLITRIPGVRAASQTAAGRRQIGRIRDLVNTTLAASHGAVVGVDSQGDVQEVLGSLLGTDSGGTVTLPNGVSSDNLDLTALRDGRTQQGRAGNTVFTAVPLTALQSGVTPVLVLANDVNTRPFGAAGGAVLGAALIALVVAAAVAAVLARRLTRPIAAMETTARAIADGDLTARVEETHVRDDELGSLAHAINGMARELEEAQGHERAFLLSVSHDLRTPLTSIRGYADAIADGTVVGPDARIRAAEVISSESRRLERLVADLLDLARLDTRQFSLRPVPVDARTVVAGAVEAFQPSAGELGITLVSEAGDALPVEHDPQRLAQIVANLVENALKFASARVDVSARAIPTGIEVLVDDDGPGIAPADLPHVFDRLYTSRTVPGRVVGTGIGLAIVRELAVAMGGTARVETVDASGTRFVVTLPTTQPGSQQ